MSTSQIKLNGTTIISENNGKVVYNITPTTEPITANSGDFYLDSSSNFFRIYLNGSFQNIFNANIGATIDSPFSSCSDISDVGYTGIKKLYTTFGGSVSATPVMVDFDTSGGPWIMMSFRFGVGGLDSYNDCVYMMAQSPTNSPISNTGRSNDQGNLGLGDGAFEFHKIFCENLGNVSNISTIGAEDIITLGGYGIYTRSIDYYNHGTNTLFSSTEVSAIQDWVAHLCPLIPHCATETDSQGLTSGDAWDDQAGPDSDGGWQLWLQDKNNAWMRATPKDNTTDESSSAYLWTENSYSESLFPAGNFSNMNTSITNSTGMYTTKMIIPKNLATTSGTGGGCMFGSPLVRNFRNGLGNTYNNRNYFLIKD